MQVLILKETEVERLGDDALVLDTVEEAFRLWGQGRAEMPSKSYLTFPESHGDLRTMPAYLPSLNAAGVKIVNSHPGNPKIGLPTVMATLILNDPATGRPLAIMGATVLTALRTGAAGALAVRVLARAEAGTAGFIGGGTQARYQLRFLLRVRPVSKIRVFDIDPARADSFCDHARRLGLTDVKRAASAREAAGESIVITTTPGTGPVCEASAFEPGTHVNAIGADAPGKQELPAGLLARAKVVVDHRDQASHSGEINVPLEKGVFRPDQIHAELGDIIAGKRPGRAADDEITLFDSTGIAILDVAVAKRIYDRAVDGKIGKRVEI